MRKDEVRTTDTEKSWGGCGNAQSLLGGQDGSHIKDYVFQN
jgi:hypothetical protein